MMRLRFNEVLKFFISDILCLMLWLRISSSHFAKWEGILSFCKAFFQIKNKNYKLSISCLAPKFYLVTIIAKHNIALQKHLISLHDLILQPPRQAKIRAVCLTPFMFYARNFLYFSHSVLYNCQITVKGSSLE